MKKYLLPLTIIPFYILLCRLVGNDYYYDEYYMMHHRVFNPLWDIVSKYNSLNTHQLMAIWCKLLSIVGGVNLSMAMDTPDIMRLPQLIFSATTIYYLWKIGKSYFSQPTGLLSVLILLTTLPYYYYALQIRGYALSVMLMTMILYYLWGDNLSRHKQILLVLLTALFGYTLSSNFCFIVIIIGYTALTRAKYLKSLLLGSVAGLCLYIPLMGGMLSDLNVNSKVMFAHSTETMTSTLWEVISGFVSHRWLLPVLSLIGYSQMKVLNSKIILCMIMLIVPFILFALHGGKIYGRFMLPALPCFCIIMAVGIDNAIGLLKTGE